MKLNIEMFEWVRKFSQNLPESNEETSLRKPVFQYKKKTFVFLDEENEAIIVRTSVEELEKLLTGEHYFKPPFCSKKTPWLGINITKSTSRNLVEQLIQKSYNIVEGGK